MTTQIQRDSIAQNGTRKDDALVSESQVHTGLAIVVRKCGGVWH